jgi:Raf kinase inhibitor-like YbhB/YbcL family protein
MKTSLLALGAMLACAAPALAAEPFRLTSPDFQDNGVLARKYGGATPENKNCLGQNVNPALSWTPGPEGSKSYVLTMVDLAGRGGTGVDHWVAYGIPANVTKIPEGEGAKPQSYFVGGVNTSATQVYFGPCPGPGTGYHHYVFTLVATDLAPGDLKPGLTRADLLKAIAGHAKGVTDLVLRMEHPGD